MDDEKVENLSYNVIPVTEYDPFEAKFAASLYWLVFRATEDGEFDNIPSQVTSPIQRDSEKRITVRPEVTEFLTDGEIYCKVCDSIFHGKVPIVGQWALIQTLSRHGFYVVEEGDIAVTDSALQQKKPFRKSTHLALMDCLMSAFSTRAVTVQQVVQCVSKFSSFNASKELPFDLEDALLLWINKISATLNENQLKKQKQHAEQLLQNQDKAKRFRFRRDQLQPKVQTAFPMMEELLKDINDGKSLLGIIMFYHPTVINLDDVRFTKDLSTEDCVHNLDRFRSLCSQFICTSVLALKVEDLLYGSQAMKPNIIALLAEIFNKCEMESLTPENGVIEKQTSKSDVDLRYISANKENVMDNKSSSAPALNSDKSKSVEHGGLRESLLRSKSERLSSMSGHLNNSASESVRQDSVWKSQSDSQVNSNSRLSFKSPFHLDFTVDNDVEQTPLNGPLPKQGTDNYKEKEKENPFSGILQRPVLAGDSRKHSLPASLHGSPRTTPRQDAPLLLRRNKQKQRTLDFEDWDMQQEEVEELQLNDLQRSQSLTGLDKAKVVEPRQSFHAWREDTGASLSDSNLASSRSERISLDFRPNPTSSAPQRTTEGSAPQRGAQGIHVPVTSSGLKAKRDEHTSQDSLSSSPKSTDSLNMRPAGDRPRERQYSIQPGVQDSCTSDISTKELKQFEEIEAMVLAGRSVETPRKFSKPTKLPSAPSQEEEDDLNTSVSSEDMNKFRLEVLQRLTEDKLREIPDEVELEDDDDPIMLARNNAVSSPRNPPEQRTRLEVAEPPVDVPDDQLSPITEGTEPCPSVTSNPNSASSANSTAPSSPCSPLDIAPFMPEFFTTSPANTLDRKKQRMSLKEREDERTLVAEEEDEFPSDPQYSATPRFQTLSANKTRDFPSKSFEKLARGSYTVGQGPVESAQAAGIPVINASLEDNRPRLDSSSSQSVFSETGDVLHSRRFSQRESTSSRDLSGFRPLALSSGGVEANDAFPAEGVDGRRDSLEGSPAHSPALTRGKRDEAVIRSRDFPAQDSPGDVVIFERSLSKPHEGKEDIAIEDLNENAPRNSATVTKAKKPEAYVFDFNQDVVQSYENDPAPQDFRTFKKDNHGLPQGTQGFQGSQQEGHFATFGKNSHGGTQEHRLPNQSQDHKYPNQQASATEEFVPREETHPRRHYEENPSVDAQFRDLRKSDGFTTFRKDTAQERDDGGTVAEPSANGLDVRRSDGYSTFRKEAIAGTADEPSAQKMALSVHNQRQNEADQFATFAKSAKKHESSQHYAGEEMHHLAEVGPSTVIAARSIPSQGGEDEGYTTPRGGEEEQVRFSGSSNITRSRTFRKKPDGQIIESNDIGTDSNSPRQDTYDKSASTNSASTLTGQQTVNKHIRGSPDVTGSENPHRISWTDDTEAGARLSRQLNASVDRAQSTHESHETGSSRRRSPRQSGRGSPGSRISWLTAAKSGVGGQVMLDDKGYMQEETRNETFANELSNERQRFVATAVFRPKQQPHDEAAPWKGRENGAKVPEDLGLRAVTCNGPCSHANGQVPNMFSSASGPEVEPDSRTGGSIRDRIAALSAAAGVTRLNVTSGVAFDVGFQSASKPRPPPRLVSRFRTKNVERNDESLVSKSQIVSSNEIGPVKDKSIAFEVNFDDEPCSKRAKDEPVLLQSPFKAFKTRSNHRRQQKTKPSSPQAAQTFSPWKAGARGFQASSPKDDSKLSSDVVDNKSLDRLDNKTGQKQCEFSFVQSKRFTEKASSGELTYDRSLNDAKSNLEDLQDKSNSEGPKFLKRNTFTLDTVSNQGLPIVAVLNELASKEETKQETALPSSELVPKRSTFTLDSVSQSIENESREGVPVASVLNDLATKQEFEQKLQSDVDTSSLLNENSQKRSTFTLESVAQEIDNAIAEAGILDNALLEGAKIEDEESFQIETVNVDTLANEDLSLEKKHKSSENLFLEKKPESTEKRSTYTLDTVSSSLQSGAEEGVPVSEVLSQLATREELKSSTLSDAEDSLTQTECAPKRGTFTLDTVSQSLDDAQSKGLPAVDVLDQLASKHESYLPVSTPLEHNSNSRPTQNRGTYTLDTVSHAIEEAVEKGVPVSVTLNHLAQEGKPAHNYDDSSAGKVVHGLKSQSEARPSSPDDRDEIEASFEDALEQLEDCLNFVSFPSASDHKRRSAYRKRMSLHQEQSSPNREPSSSNRKQSSSDRERSSLDRDSSSSNREHSASSDRERSSSDRDSAYSDQEHSSFERTRTSPEAPEKRGTYNLDEVANSVEHGLKDGVPVVETLDDLSKTKSHPKDGSEKTPLPEQRRGTYTLDEVSRSLQTASKQGIPVVEALKNLTIENDPARGTGESKQKRGTYTLDDVSKSLEHANNTGIPVVKALESLSKEKPTTPLRLKIPERSPENRGTYTLDGVSNTLEKAKQKGLPVVDALGQITTAKDVSIRQTPDAVHRRQEKLVNRKTYALASPLETIGEGTKLRLYDGSQRQMLSPLSFHMKTKDMTPSKSNSNESKARGLGVVQKLDFLTSACELLLQANAKEIAKDGEQAESLPESIRNNPTTDESFRRSHEIHSEDVEVESCMDGEQTERRTYSLDSVSKSIDDAKAAGIPIVDALKNVTSVSKAGSTSRSNLRRLNSKSDSELINEGNQKPYSNRQTHSLEDMSMTLEEAKRIGIPVIQALDQLANELAEFSKNTLGEEVEIKPLGKDNRKRKRHSDIPMRRPSQELSPDPSPMRKAFSLDDVAFAVQKAFQSGTSLNDLLDSLASEKPADQVLSSRDIRPRSVDSGFISSLSDYDISSYSFDSSRNRSNTYIFDSSSEELDLAKTVSPQVKEKTVHEANTTGSLVQGENRRTFTLDHVSGSVARELSRDIPVIEALEKLSLNSPEVKTDKAKEKEWKENAKSASTELSDNVKTSNSGRKKSPPKPKRKISNNKNSQQPNSDPFVIEFFSSSGSEQTSNRSKFEIVNNRVQEVNFTNNDTNATKPEKDIKSAGNKVELDKTSSLAPTGEHKSVELRNDSNSTPSRGRATWRPSGSVLDKIASLMDAAEDCGISPSDVLNQVTDLPYDDEGEIVETPDDVTEQKKETSQIAYLRMQLEEKRRHIEAEKYRAQAEWEDQRRRLGQTAFWYVIGKAQGGQNVGEGTGTEVAQPEKPFSQEKPRKPVAEFPNQPSPPIAWSSPANSPAPVFKPANDPQYKTREFRLSDYPPAENLGTNQDTVRPSSQPAVEVGSRPIAVPPRPSSHDPAASHYTAPPRKCWDVDVAQVPTPPPLVHPDMTPVRTDAKKENPQRKPFEREIEVETNPAKKGMAMFIGDDASPASQGLTPEQERKREKFLRLREKKQEEDRLRKEAELEKKRRREEKQREKEMQQRMEEERLHREELERQNAEQELRMREAQTARVPDSYTTYRRPGTRHQAYDVNEDTNNYYSPTPTQPSGFAEFSGPQCYVKPSGKSNRKIIVNAISHVCLSGTVNQDQKEKCLQAISESDGHHFMILFKDGLKFRGMYVHNLENDQLFKVFGIGPRVITSKMIEGFYKYNSGGKEFTKIPSKTLSIAVDGLAIQKSYWQSGKPAVQSKTSSNLKRPPRPPQR